MTQNLTLTGIQWGDEGKGKIVDFLAARFDAIVRFQGGNNAGHTIVVGGTTFKLSSIPSGILTPKKLNVIGGGTVLDPWAFLQEMSHLAQLGIDISPQNLVIADNTPLILPVHKALDALREKAAGDSKIGTTLRGIGPAYEDKVGRRSIRVADLTDSTTLRSMIDHLYQHHNIWRRGMGEDELDPQQVFQDLIKIAPEIVRFAQPAWRRLDEIQSNGGSILFEGAQGALLDIEYGSYPFVTSSSTLPGAAASGGGLGPGRLGHILGICKAYCTRVGAGPFPSEISDEMGAFLAAKGHERGTVTGRPRRCGWFDAVLARQVCKIAGVNSLALTKLDVLQGIDELKVCTAYELDGQTIDYFPTSPQEQARLKPIFESLPTWREPIEMAQELPTHARQYIARIEEWVGIPISLLSISPKREDTLILTQDF